MWTALLFAAAATFPTLPQINTTPALGSGSGVTNFTFYVAGDNRPDGTTVTVTVVPPTNTTLCGAAPSS